MEPLSSSLQARKREGTLRSLRPASLREGGRIYFGKKRLLDMASNDYLGLSGHPELKKAAAEAAQRYGTSSAASRLLSGDLESFHELEETVASFKGKEAALIFNTGYQANIGVISALCGRDDIVLLDRLSHASIIDGAVQSKAHLVRFRHNDVRHLEELLKEKRHRHRRSLILTESVFSMDGDIAPVKRIAELKEEFDSFFMLDEAHATGIFGPSGSGIAEREGVTQSVDVIMGTFGKALGSFGAYVALSDVMRDFLVNNARSFIYSTALPPSVIAASQQAIRLLAEEPERRERLLEMSSRFRREVSALGLETLGESQIVPVVAGDTETALSWSRELFEAGYWVPAIRPPTVPKGSSRLRFSLNFTHSPEDMDGLLRYLGRLKIGERP